MANKRVIAAIKEVSKSYQLASGPFYALSSINLEIYEAEFVAVVGKSGSGKSTLLNMLTGIDRPTAGEIHVDGTALHDLKEKQMGIWRREHIGIVFQFFQLLPTLTIAENVMLPMDFAGSSSIKEQRERAMSLLEQVNIADQADKFPLTLSGGQQQRAAIARALANDPPLIVADEPTGNLDASTSAEVLALFAQLVDQGKTLVVVSHEEEIANWATSMVTLVDGKIVADGVTV